MAADRNDQRFPTADEEARFWGLLEAAWAPLDDQITQARRALASRVPDEDGDSSIVSIIDDAFEEFLRNLTSRAEGCRRPS
jgi:hypothetical protein